MSTLLIKINQEIYFLTKDLELYEKYTVNNHTIIRKLGNFENDSYIIQDRDSFSKRRANFHGAKLTGLTENWFEAIQIVNMTSPAYDEINERYDVTNLVSGTFYDIFKVIIDIYG